uniref:J domain-containing protein n=1 Tax=Globodera pallida TaxID=36090 RepID=A0A183CPU2_GLOPA
MNYYELLGVSDKANPDEINKVYRERMRAYHPDRNPNGKAMSRLFTEAKETLMDPHKKGIYDQQMYNYATVVHHQGGEPMDYTVVVPVLASIIKKDPEDHMMDAFTGVGGVGLEFHLQQMQEKGGVGQHLPRMPKPSAIVIRALVAL